MFKGILLGAVVFSMSVHFNTVATQAVTIRQGAEGSHSANGDPLFPNGHNSIVGQHQTRSGVQDTTIFARPIPSARLTPSVSVSTADNSTTSSTDFTVQVSGLDQNTKWRDLHIWSARSRKFPRLLTTTGTTVSPTGGGSNQIWNLSRSSGGDQVNVYSGTETGFGNGTYTFNVAWNTTDYGTAKPSGISWRATKDGTEFPATDKSDKIVDDNESGDPIPKTPQNSCTLNDDNALAAPKGATTAIGGSASVGLAGHSYQIYSSTTLVPDYSDSLHIGIDTTGNPIPTSWDLSFAALTGTLSSNGTLNPQASVTVPNNSALVGNVFYLVLAINYEGQIMLSSSPVKVTITN